MVGLVYGIGPTGEAGLSVRGKIFLLACAMAALFAVVVGTSLSGLYGVQRELRVLTEVLQPLDHHVARMTLAQTQTGAALIDGLDLIDPSNPAGAVSLRDDLTAHAAEVRASLAAFTGELEAAKPYLTPFEDREETLRLRETVGEIERRGEILAREIDRLASTVTLGNTPAFQRAAIRIEGLSLSFVDGLVVLEGIFDDIDDRSALEAESHERRVTSVTAIFALLIGLVAVYGSFHLSRLITDPLARLVAVAREVEAGRLDVEAKRTSRDEVGWLTMVFNDMIRGLRIKERIKSTFGKYVDPRIVDQLISSEQEALASTVRPLTVLRTRHNRFSSLAASLSSEALVETMNSYYTAVSHAIFEKGGVVDTMHSDTVLAFFGPPFQGEEAHFVAACEAALAERDLRATSTAANAGAGGATTIDGSDLHVALSVGPCIVGTMGSDVSKTFTAMGENVALTPFILAACDYYKIPILVVAEEEPSASPTLVFRQLDYVVFPDRSRPVRLFELVGRKDDIDESTIEFIRRYEEGAAALRDRRWSDAIEALDACIALKPDDKPTQLLTERIDLCSFDPPPETWDGSWDLTGS